MTLSASPASSAIAGPSSLTSDSSSQGVSAPTMTNGHTNGFGPALNGSSGAGGEVMANGALSKHHGKSIAKITLPGTTLYDDSDVDREEFVRLVIQSLRDVGYIESAATLEAESGYTMEAADVAHFRQYVLDGMWAKAEAALERLGVDEDEGIWDARFLISRQKYLELIEAKKPTAALQVLRNELAPLNVEPEQLYTLSSLIMCTEPEDLRRRAGWDGASGTSRRHLLDTLHDYIPSAIMIPQRRFATLLQQAKTLQRQRCIYHNPPKASKFSLYADHRCNKSDFPRVTTFILEVHTDEVWNIKWSHDGRCLASASKDKTAIIWRRTPSRDPSLSPEWSAHLTLRDHQFPVGCLAWSIDDSILLTSTEHIIKMWNTKTGACTRTLEHQHSEPVTALSWLPDGSGFISGGLDRNITIWNADGKARDAWGRTSIRLTDFSITPDSRRLIAVGMEHAPYPSAEQQRDGEGTTGHGNSSPPQKALNMLVVFDLATKQVESSTRFDGELTSVQTTRDSPYILINHSPNEVKLWDPDTSRTVRSYTHLKQSKHVIRSCFGGIDGNFVVSGSEDGTVYVWHRDSGVLLETLVGHGEGSVNCVAWNPTNERMFASCSDDKTVRIWEVPPGGSYLLPETPVSQPAPTLSSPSVVEKGKGKRSQPQDGSDASLSSWFNADGT